MSLEGGRDGGAYQDANSSTPPSPAKTWIHRLGLLAGSATVLALTQVAAYLGKGLPDPFFGPDVTVMQITAAIAAAIQLVAFVPAFLWQTEAFYDLTGSLTYIVCVAYSLGAGYTQSVTRSDRAVDPRAFAVSCMVWLWAARLGYFLFTRILNSPDGDTRFLELKPDPFKFLIVWALQALWIVLGCLPAFILNSTQTFVDKFLWSDAVGGILFVTGLLGEALADRQKSQWRKDPGNKGKWIDHAGLWTYSRHPNYFFEWQLHLGMFIFCTAEFQDSQWVAAVSPVFIALLLGCLSGVPLLEKRADEKWGDDVEYQRYKRSTSVCVPICCKLPREEKDMFPGQSWLVW